MTSLASLWLPILLSAVAVFVASFVLHMVLPWHKGDYAQLPREAQVMDALRPFAIAPGDYMVPRPADPAQMKTPQFQEKLQKGPVMILTVMPNGMFSMGNALAQWFVYCLVVGLFTGAVAFVSYALALWQISIWYHRSWATTIRSTIDGLIYAALTAGFFGWLWPAG